MSKHGRDLRNAGFYLTGLLLFAIALVFGAPPLAERALASAPFGGLPFASQLNSENAPTRLSIAVENAREIRAALAKPLPPLEPLPPITAKLAYGHLKPDARGVRHHARLPSAGMNAMAQAAVGTEPDRPRMPSHAAAPPLELHRVY